VTAEMRRALISVYPLMCPRRSNIWGACIIITPPNAVSKERLRKGLPKVTVKKCKHTSNHFELLAVSLAIRGTC
jgi:hypothetical protein